MSKVLVLTAFFICNIANADLIIFAEGFENHSNLVADFESQTGEKVILLNSNFEENLKRVKVYSSAEELAKPNAAKLDLIITKDLVYLSQLKAEGLTQPFDNLPVFKDVREGMIDKDQNWVALTYRARTLAYRDDVDVSTIETYADLASPDVAGQLCLRTSNSSYNTGLVSYLITEYGESDAKDILLGWVDNLAEPVFSNDTKILEAISTGVCDIGIVNHYYLARLQDQANQNGTTLNVNIKYLNQGQGGVHVNGYGVALLRTSEQKDLAQKFVEMLLSEKAQNQIATSQYSFPTNKNFKPQSLIQDWGTFEANTTYWSEIGNNIEKAKQLFKEVNYN